MLTHWTDLLIVIPLAVLAYTWIGYPVLIVALSRLFPLPLARDAIHPRVSLILAAHNEERCVAEKLRDCLNLAYPADLIEFIIASDNSTDATERIVQEFAARDPRIRLLRTGGRAGKSAAQNLAAENARGEILFFTDAGTRMREDALEILMQNFADPHVGLATATIRFLQPAGAVAQGQGIYWRYELMIRRAESVLGVLAKGSGQALAMRRSLFSPMQPCFGDDCVLPLQVRLQNFRVVHDSRALVTDTMPHTLEGEMRARVRMTARNWTGTFSELAILNPWRFPLTSWALLSHKLLRWLSPLFLVALFVASAVSALQLRWVEICVVQMLFYAAALFGWQAVRRGRAAGIFGYAFAFCLANAGFLLGLIRGLRSQRIVAY